jgi:hypothetical protein
LITWKIMLYSNIARTVCPISHWGLLYCPHWSVPMDFSCRTINQTLDAKSGWAFHICQMPHKMYTFFRSEQRSYIMNCIPFSYIVILCFISILMPKSGLLKRVVVLIFILLHSWMCVLTQYLPVLLSFRHTCGL